MSPLKWANFILVLAFSLAWAGPVFANENTPQNPSNCIVCHENLYYQHDTGKHFCISEASQRCTDCHGGDPNATEKEAAHQQRSAHPVVNGNFSKCQECHPADFEQYVQTFSQVAGISPVFVASRPVLMAVAPDLETANLEARKADNWPMFIPVIAGGFMIGLALLMFISHIRRSG